MSEAVYPPASAQLAERRRELAPEIHDAFQRFSRQVLAGGALDTKVKQLIAVALADVTQCPCIRGHTKAALRAGASEQELIEAIWVAAEIRAGGAYAHTTLAPDATAPGAPPEERPDEAGVVTTLQESSGAAPRPGEPLLSFFCGFWVNSAAASWSAAPRPRAGGDRRSSRTPLAWA